MRLTAKLKQWAKNTLGVPANATDDEFKEAIAGALVEGELTHKEFGELSTTREDAEGDEFGNLLKGMATSIDLLTKTLEDDKATAGDDDKKGMECDCGGKLQQKGDDYACTKCGKAYDAEGKAKKDHTPSGTKGGKPMNWMEKAFTGFGGHSEVEGGEEKAFTVRVKEAADSYDHTRKSLTFPALNVKGKPHAFAGMPVRDYNDGGEVMYAPSERDKAVAGAFAMFEVERVRTGSRTLAFMKMPHHAKELLCFAMENERWGGSTNGGNFADIEGRKMTQLEQKALIDDATSGGLEAAPIVFDDQVIQAPLLHGELFPLVSVKPLDRGRRIEGVATGTVTSSWGGVDDTAITLFTTTSYVSAFDTTIFRWEGAIRIGLDFLSDTPIDFGQHISTQYGERLLEDLDDVIATGNGTTQPEGVQVKSGTTSVTFGGTTTLGNYESLRFGVAKAEHRSTVAATAVFCGTEESYMRARAIPVGASDARRLGGMDYSSYQWMERPYKINESMANTDIFYAILARYRMYRRRGLTMRTSTEGDTLIRNNEMLMTATARYGGQLERGACAAKTDDAPA
jgi:hypothetical protein